MQLIFKRRILPPNEFRNPIWSLFHIKIKLSWSKQGNLWRRSCHMKASRACLCFSLFCCFWWKWKHNVKRGFSFSNSLSYAKHGPLHFQQKITNIQFLTLHKAPATSCKGRAQHVDRRMWYIPCKEYTFPKFGDSCSCTEFSISARCPPWELICGLEEQILVHLVTASASLMQTNQNKLNP